MKIIFLIFSFLILIPLSFSELFEKLNRENMPIIKDENRTYLIDDFCNIGQSKIINNFFKEIMDFFNISIINNESKNKCMILDEIFNKYYSQFDKISSFNKDSYIYFTCPLCQKNFKTESLLNLHYKLFHMKFNESLICPGDFCMSINCNRYYDYFNVKKYSKRPQDVKFNRQPVEKDETCENELIFFYKSSCMKLIEGCFGEDKQKYYRYYKYICNQINCNTNSDSQISKESNISDIFRYIFMYLFAILGTIYLIIVWLTKYA